MGETSNFSDLLQLMPSCACAIVFVLLILLDVWNAWKRRAHWIPAQALALSALTLQLLAFINYSAIDTFDDTNHRKQQAVVLLNQNQLVVDSGRAIFCVLIGYLLPGMVRYHWTNAWGDIGAFTLSLLANMASELYFVWKVKRRWEANKEAKLEDNSTESFWFMVSSTTISVTIILLAPLLGCVVLAGKSLRTMNSQKIPFALSCCSDRDREKKCKNIEDHVLKCWIVARVSLPDYIMARSVFSSFAGLVITVCNVILAVKWKYIKVPPEYDTAHKIMVLIHVAFILIGWIVIFIRWVTAVLYFKREGRLFQTEDFWTRRLVEAKDEFDGYLTGRLFSETRFRERTRLETLTVYLITKVRLHFIVLPIQILFQKLVVSLSKCCWRLSCFVLKTIWWCLSKTVFTMIPHKSSNSSHKSSNSSRHSFSEYEEALEIVKMPGEIGFNLWTANEWAFKKTENHIMEGSKVKSKELTALIEEIKGVTDEVAKKWLEEEDNTSAYTKKHFKYAGKKSWKMSAVSLIHLMIHYYDGTKLNEVNDAIRAYWQVWDIIGMVDSSDPEANLVSAAADKEWDALKKICEKHLEMKYPENEDHEGKASKELLQQLTKDLRQIESQKQLEELLSKRLDLEANLIERSRVMDNQSDSMDWTELEKCMFKTGKCINDSEDWTEIAARISMFKTLKFINVAGINVNSPTKISELRRLFANIIVHCIKKEVENALIEKCNKWAEDGNEQEIYRAAFVAGKTASIKDFIEKTKDYEGNHPIDHQVAGGQGNDAQDQLLGVDSSSGRSKDIGTVDIDAAVVAPEAIAAPYTQVSATPADQPSPPGVSDFPSVQVLAHRQFGVTMSPPTAFVPPYMPGVAPGIHVPYPAPFPNLFHPAFISHPPPYFHPAPPSPSQPSLTPLRPTHPSPSLQFPIYPPSPLRPCYTIPPQQHRPQPPPPYSSTTLVSPSRVVPSILQPVGVYRPRSVPRPLHSTLPSTTSPSITVPPSSVANVNVATSSSLPSTLALEQVVQPTAPLASLED